MATKPRSSAAATAELEPQDELEEIAPGTTPVEIRAGDDAPTNGDEHPAPGPVNSLADLKHALEADDRPVVRVTVTEWPGSPAFYLRGLTGAQRDEMEIAMSRMLGGAQYIFFDNSSAHLVARALCTEDGRQLVTKKELPQVVAQLAERSAGGLLRLNRVAQRLSGLADSDIEELVDDLKDDPSADSGTG